MQAMRVLHRPTDAFPLCQRQLNAFGHRRGSFAQLRLFGLQRTLCFCQHLFQPRSGIGGHHRGQRPFDQRCRAQLHLGGQRRIQQIDCGFGTQQRTAQIHQHHNARTLSHRLNGFHHFDCIGAYRMIRIIDTRRQHQFTAVAAHHLQRQLFNPARQ